MSDWTERLQNWNEADAALTKAIDENREYWGWTFDEMTDAQAEGLNAFFAATQKLADAAIAEIDRLQAELDAAVRQRDEQATIVNHLLRKNTP